MPIGHPALEVVAPDAPEFTPRNLRPSKAGQPGRRRLLVVLAVELAAVVVLAGELVVVVPVEALAGAVLPEQAAAVRVLLPIRGTNPAFRGNTNASPDSNTNDPNRSNERNQNRPSRRR
jgi:hypothetical protein